MGTTCEYPPPAAPPLMPKVGPCEGCRMLVKTRFFKCAPMAWQSPTVVVDLPSPSGVGLMPDTSTYLPFLLSLSRSSTESFTLALYDPCRSSSSGRMPAAAATTLMSSGVVACEISMSLGTLDIVPPVLLCLFCPCLLSSSTDDCSWLGVCLRGSNARWFRCRCRLPWRRSSDAVKFCGRKTSRQSLSQLVARLATETSRSDTMELRLDVGAVDGCSFETWYPSLQGRGATVRSEVLALPDSFVAYLSADGIVLPPAPPGLELRGTDPRRTAPATEDSYDVVGDVDWDDSSDDSDDSDDAAEEQDEQEQPGFPELEAAVDAALTRLKDEVFVKLNWTSPQDAAWAAGGLKCRSVGEVLLLLKSSDFVQHDLHHAYENCWDWDRAARPGSAGPAGVKLVLRRWSHLNRAMEFRCFVLDGKLAAVAQRYVQDFYAFLQPGCGERDAVVEAVQTLFAERGVAEALPQRSCVVDVFVDKQSRAWLLDFAPLPAMLALAEGEAESETSLALKQVPPHELISWDELRDLAARDHDQAEQAQQPAFFVVHSKEEAASAGDVKSAHRVPIELVTGELTQEVVDQAKAQLATLSLSSSS